MSSKSALVTALAVAALALVHASTAFACACCSSLGSRYDAVQKLDAQRIGQIDGMVFGKTAKVASGEADVEIKGVAEPESDYQLAVAREKKRFVFTLRDAKGRAGTLVLALPATIAIFEVDPRHEDKEGGLGPLLYKEWKLTAPAAGDGLFAKIVGKGQTITLVLHGHGRGCTEASDFTAWTLLVQGREKLTLVGALER
jgi:hypothetical protein